jgi:hypothetical protein
MRSRFVVCAALAGIGLLGAWSPAHAADPKAKSGKKKSGDGLSDDKVIDKQLQWEDSVMGPDDKRGELDKIARAQAINKAASEKAERDKEKAAAAAAKEPPAPSKAQTNKRGGEVALPTLPDEDSGNGNKAGRGKSSEISPKLETTAAAAPPPPVRHGDDKFIDKLLKDEPSSKKKKASSASDDKDLDDLLAVGKPAKPAAAKGKGKRGDDVDSLLDSADKAPPMPETKVKHETPEWAKPEIESAPAQAPVVVRPQPKRDDGIIHVVQGAAPTGRPMTAPTRAPAGTRPASFATRTPAPSLSPAARRQQPAGRPAGWNDPFADGPKKTVAARETRGSMDEDDDAAPAPSRRRAAALPPPVTKAEASRSARGARSSDRGSDNDWSDPFKDSAKTTNTRRAAPAAKPAEPPARRGAWKDPFTEETRASHPAHAAVAMREPRKGESTRWEVAEKKSAPAADASGPVASTRGRWGVLKKRAR